MKKLFILFSSCVLLLIIARGQAPADGQGQASAARGQASTDGARQSPADDLALMKKVAGWQLSSWSHSMRWPAYDWVNAAGYTGILALGQASEDTAYYKALREIGNSLDWNTGPRRTMADDYCIGQTYAQLSPLYK